MVSMDFVGRILMIFFDLLAHQEFVFVVFLRLFVCFLVGGLRQFGYWEMSLDQPLLRGGCEPGLKTCRTCFS